MQPKGWIPFLTNKNEFLWFCLTCRESGISAGQRLGIADKVMAWDLDNAVTLRLLQFDTEKEAANKRFWVRLVTGEDIGGNDDSVLDATELHPLVRDDPFADANTILS